VAAYRVANREKVLASQRATYYKHQSKRIANSQKWAANNPARRKQIESKYRSNHRKEVAERSESWRLLHPEKPRLYKLKRRAKLETNGIFEITNKDIKRLYGSFCYYCGSNERIEADHIIPISKGGQHKIGNLLPACRFCNASKGYRFISEWKLAKLQEGKDE